MKDRISNLNLRKITMHWINSVSGLSGTIMVNNKTNAAFTGGVFATVESYINKFTFASSAAPR